MRNKALHFTFIIQLLRTILCHEEWVFSRLIYSARNILSVPEEKLTELRIIKTLTISYILVLLKLICIRTVGISIVSISFVFIAWYCFTKGSNGACLKYSCTGSKIVKLHGSKTIYLLKSINNRFMIAWWQQWTWWQSWLNGSSRQSGSNYWCHGAV